MADQPSGAVTFLFTDIEGSTRAVKQLRERYADVLAEHQRLLRAAFEAHEGYEVDTQGDSFFVAFSSAREALLAAVDGQRALGVHSWPDDAGVKVRMGLHTGHAQAAGGRYTGLAVHRAARIGAVGHGGQILVSQATQTLLEDEEEDLGVTLLDLGEHRLKDLDRPVRIYQAAADGLLTDFPPIRPGADTPPVAPPLPFWRRRVAIVAAAIGLLVIVAATAAFALNGGPASVAVRPNSVAVIDPEDGRVIADIQVGTRPEPITSGGRSIWVGNLDDETLTRIDTERREVQKNIPLNGQTPTGLAYGFDAVWVAHGILGTVSRVDPQFEVVGPPIPVGGRSVFGQDNGTVDVGPDAVWAVFNDSTLAAIDPTTQRVKDETRAGTNPAGIVVGSGSVWVSNSGQSKVWRYDPAAFNDPIGEISVGGKPTGITDGEGAIWVANTADDSVSRIDPDAGAVRALIPVGAGPTAVTVGADAVWVVNSEAGTLSRIDPEQDKAVDTVEIGNRPAGIAFADGLLWVTVQAP
jgi:YVTN family beta-propeller protein